MTKPVMPDLRLRDFHNRLRILLNIDMSELVDGGAKGQDDG